MSLSFSGNTTSPISVKDFPEASCGPMALAASLNLQPSLEIESLVVCEGTHSLLPDLNRPHLPTNHLLKSHLFCTASRSAAASLSQESEQSMDPSLTIRFDYGYA